MLPFRDVFMHTVRVAFQQCVIYLKNNDGRNFHGHELTDHHERRGSSAPAPERLSGWTPGFFLFCTKRAYAQYGDRRIAVKREKHFE
jgi:hypothetical protein